MKTKIIILFLLSFQFVQSQTWVRKLDGFSMLSIAKNQQGNIFAGSTGTTRSLFKSTNWGNSWDTLISGGASNYLYISCDSGNCVWVANLSNGLLKSTNGGLNFITIPISTFNNKNVQCVACGRNGYVYVGCSNGGIFRSTDNGNTFPDTALSTLMIVCIYVDRSNPDYIYAGSSSLNLNGFYRSTDGGLTFSGNLNQKNIYFIMQKPNNFLYTVSTSTPYALDKSTNFGLNWTSQSTFAGANRGICYHSGGSIYVAGNGGVQKSTDDGLTFTNWNLTYSSNQIITFQNRVLVTVSGTTNGGVWIYTDSLLEVKKNDSPIPQNFSLSQNYPNPFNPTTKIQLTIPPSKGVSLPAGAPAQAGGMDVRLIIYDLLGREVTTLVSQQLKPGTYEVEWDASNYPSGVYFYRVMAEDVSAPLNITKKMVLVK